MLNQSEMSISIERLLKESTNHKAVLQVSTNQRSVFIWCQPMRRQYWPVSRRWRSCLWPGGPPPVWNTRLSHRVEIFPQQWQTTTPPLYPGARWTLRTWDYSASVSQPGRVSSEDACHLHQPIRDEYDLGQPIRDEYVLCQPIRE